MLLKKLITVSLALIICATISITGLAQQKTESQKANTKESKSTQKSNSDSNSSGETKSVTTKKISKRKTVVEKVVELPSLDERLVEQRQAVRKGDNREPSSPYLIEEVVVQGIYKSVEGYGAFLKAVNGKTFFAYSGMPLYDGSVFQIDADQVVFEQKGSDGKKRQIIKPYDPSSLRNATLEEKEKKEKEKEKEKKKKAKKKAEDEDEEAADDGKDE